MPPLLAIYAVVASVIFILGSGVSWKITSDYYEAKHAKDDRKAREQYEETVEKMNNLAFQLEEARSESRIVYRTIEKKIPEIVERPVYRNECVDSDGLQLINEALHPRKLAKPLPSPDALGGEDGS